MRSRMMSLAHAVVAAPPPVSSRSGRPASLLIPALAFVLLAGVADTRAEGLSDPKPGREAALIHKIERLERRLQELEAKLERRTAPRRYDGPAVSGRGGRGQNPNAQPEAASGADGAQASTATATTTSPNSIATTPAALSSPDDLNALRDLMVIRDQAVTVQKGGFEIGGQFRYVRTSSFLQFSRAAVFAASARYGIWEGMEASVNVPYYSSFRSTQTAPNQYETNDFWAFGDVTAQVTATLLRETLDWPGIFGYVAVSFPTGPAPYSPGPNIAPFDPFRFFQSSGHYAVTGGATFVKTYEPVALFAGISYTYFVPREFTGRNFAPGDRVGYSAGLGFSVSERTTLGAMVQGAVQNDMTMDGLTVPGTNAESVALTLSVSQRLSPTLWLEPSVTVGMTADVPSAGLGVSVRKKLR